MSSRSYIAFRGERRARDRAENSVLLSAPPPAATRERERDDQNPNDATAPQQTCSAHAAGLDTPNCACYRY